MTAVLMACGLALAAHPSAPADESARGVVALRLEAPLEELFAKAKSDPDAEIDGVLTDTTDGEGAKPVPVKVSLRGHTSRRETECTFPKLKVETADGRTIKLGTHCGENPQTQPSGRYGRLTNERSPLREAAVYQLLEALGVPSLHAQHARVTYVSPKGTIVRNAMILEEDREAIKRSGGKDDIEPAEFTTAEMFAPADAAALAFAEALIGNFDWCLKFSERDTYRCDARMKLWNVIAVKVGDSARPLIYDFDIAGMVTGSHLWFTNVYTESFAPPASQRAVEVIAQLQRTRSLFPRAVLNDTRRRFIAKKADAYRAAGSVPNDDEGRRYMRDYLDAFFREVESDERFYRPVVTAGGTMPRTAPNPSAPALCASRGAIPVGTPVSAPRDTSGDWIKVVLLDALWHWAPGTCPPIRTGAVWIPRSTVGRDYPAD
jgi:hypothetical protein